MTRFIVISPKKLFRVYDLVSLQIFAAPLVLCG